MLGSEKNTCLLRRKLKSIKYLGGGIVVEVQSVVFYKRHYHSFEAYTLEDEFQQPGQWVKVCTSKMTSSFEISSSSKSKLFCPDDDKETNEKKRNFFSERKNLVFYILNIFLSLVPITLSPNVHYCCFWIVFYCKFFKLSINLHWNTNNWCFLKECFLCLSDQIIQKLSWIMKK